jgi:hypothetical protein
METYPLWLLGLLPFPIGVWFSKLIAHVAFLHPLKVRVGFNATSFVFYVAL